MGNAVEELKKRKSERLPENYNSLKLSIHCKHQGERKPRELKNHQTEVMRNWERFAHSKRDEAVQKLFDMLLKTAKEEVVEKSKEAEEEIGVKGDDDEKEENNQATNFLQENAWNEKTG